ncbi:unnamed protein product [Urochloa decumbens]|uniref:DUF6598 domain-containing protein n=1 Tax=Urochloa decumbens TaxID=240449 RepID=A0ABC9D4D3_9POAL
MPGASEGDLSAVQVQAAAASSGKEKLDYEAEARLVAEARASWDRKARGEEDDEEDPEMSLDYYAYEAKQFRNFWNCLYFGYFGTFEDTMQISDMITLDSCLRKSAYTSKLSTLRFTLGIIVYSVEATISVRVSGGSWPDGLRTQFAAHTASIGGSQELILLDSGNDKLPVSGDGTITLGRRVASVEVDEELNVSVKAWQGGEVIVHTEMSFKAKRAGRSGGSLDVGFCQLDVSVAWSLLSSDGD